MKSPLEILAGALPVDPDDGTLPIEYTSNWDPDQGSWSCTWGMPETVAEKQLQALEAAGYVIVPRHTGGIVRATASDDDSIPVVLSPGRHTTIRPGETPSDAMRRLTDGEDL